MAKKKKDTLKDLNDFMQNQNKKDSSGSGDFLEKKPTTLADIESINAAIEKLKAMPAGALKEDELVDLLEKISSENQLPVRSVLLRVFTKLLDRMDDLDASDIMLKNTLFFLEYQDQLNAKINE